MSKRPGGVNEDTEDIREGGQSIWVTLPSISARGTCSIQLCCRRRTFHWLSICKHANRMVSNASHA